MTDTIRVERIKGSEFDGGIVIEIAAMGNSPKDVVVDGNVIEQSQSGGLPATPTWMWKKEKNGTITVHLMSENSVVEINR